MNFIGRNWEMEAKINLGAYSKRAYAMKKHHASRLHYDLRLEWNGVLLSWALPEDLSCRAGVIYEAIEMPDHRREYLRFEGLHKTGPIMLWDRGTWEPLAESDDIENSLRKGVLQFTLHGEKLKGGWTLIRTSTKKNIRLVWMLCKHADAFAESHTRGHLPEQWPKSVSTGRAMEEIIRDWKRPKNNQQRQMRLF
jgi:bifunctional non-homologous end joining protein LigD